MSNPTIIRRPALGAFVILSLVFSGCATPAAATPAEGAGTPGSDSLHTFVTVENRNSEDVRVYVSRDGTRVRLGAVGSMNRRTFRVPGSVAGGSGFLRLEVETLASRETYTTDLIPVKQGEAVEWQVETTLAHSTVLIR